MENYTIVFPLFYKPLVTEGLLEFFIVDSKGDVIASSTNEQASVLFVELANQSYSLPTVPNIQLM